MRADDDLLAAYCDGVTELTLDERKRVELLLANSADMRANETATRATISALRELPGEGTEPDWTAMERAIRATVGPDVPRVWWRPVWRWLVPITALATVATILLLTLGGDREIVPERDPVVAVHDAGVTLPVPATEEASALAVRLDGEDVMIDPDDEELLEVDDLLLGEADAGVESLLSGDLAWIDELDDADAEFAEKWLDERKKS